jgi:hypothetical protein
MFKSTPPAAPVNAEVTSRPTLRSIYPVWGRLSAKLQEFCRREEEILQRIKEITAKQDHYGAIIAPEWVDGGPTRYNGPPINTDKPAKPEPPVPARVLALMGDLAPPPAPPPAPASTEVTYTYTRQGDQELAELGKEYRDIGAAKDILHPLLKAAQDEGSRLLCEAYMPDYRAVAARVCSALVALGGAINAHQAFTQGMVDQGAVWSHLRPLDINSIVAAVGDPRNPQYSSLRAWLGGAAEGGHFDMKMIPAEWTPAPPPAPPSPPAQKITPNSGGRNRTVTPPPESSVIFESAPGGQ